jgi:hypothetical protein
MEVKPFLTAIALASFLAGEQPDQFRVRQLPSSPAAAAAAQASRPTPNFDEGYVGDAACRTCHQERVETFHRTAHYLTSRLPDKDSILGQFTSDASVLKTSNPDLFFRMEAKGPDFFETAVEGVSPYTTVRSERFGLVVGSGGKGQTYLYWKNDQLFQLPVSYWTALGWVNSPGYRDGTANFDRPIIPRCLECHATYFEAIPPPVNRYRTTGAIVGITCEKCHGPGRAHSERYRSKSAPTSDTAILNPMRFSRERQMDLCAWCHAGHGRGLRPWFSYIPGQPLDASIELPRPDPNAPLDVHGSQVELLRKSRCFQSSAMTCLTCHDVHVAQHDLTAFSQSCLKCHTVERCGIFPQQGRQIASNCIDCHMPKQETNLIVFERNGEKLKPQVRNHWIRAKPDRRDSSSIP